MVPVNKQNGRYKQINFIGLQNNRRPTQHTVGNVHKTMETASKDLFRNRSQNRCHTFLDCRHVCKTCAVHEALQAGKQKEVQHTPLIWRLQAPDQGSTVDWSRELTDTKWGNGMLVYIHGYNKVPD
jgi:hypothetical protein